MLKEINIKLNALDSQRFIFMRWVYSAIAGVAVGMRVSQTNSDEILFLVLSQSFKFKPCMAWIFPQLLSTPGDCR